MKVLFFMRSTVYVRNFESTLRLLAERGHDVHVIADPYRLDTPDLMGRLCREYSTIHHESPPVLPFRAFAFLGLELRRAIDYLRYLGPEFADAPKLRARAEHNAPPFVMNILARPLCSTPLAKRLLRWILHGCDRTIPCHPAVDDFMRAHDPDLVLVTPLVEPGSPQSEYLRSARALGIRTGLCVYSWDNLTNKGLIHDPLDLVTVWNEPMKREATALHRVPADRVVVTGAAPYDHWFAWKPRLSRDAFCDRVGLAADRPYLLYLCSSKFIAPNEREFVRRWVQEIRSGSEALRQVSVLVRPHPQNIEQWERADLSDLVHVAVWPPVGANPVDEESRADYYDSIHHSRAVVGVNTSALIESAIVGRGVYTVLAPEFRETQEGTLHFRHLRDGDEGLLHVAADVPEHIHQLEAAVRGVDDAAVRGRRFVDAFIRPYGTSEAAAPRLVAALEATASRGSRRPARGPWWAPLVRPVLGRVARRYARSERARTEKEFRSERGRRQRLADAAARKAALVSAKQRAAAERSGRKQEVLARRAAEQLALEQIAAKGYENYLYVRERVREMCAASQGLTPSLTDTERQMTQALAPLWNADADTIANLRRWCEPLGGIRASDYDAPPREFVLRLRRHLHVVRRTIGRDLFVQEPAALGGFGIVRNEQHYNEETLRFFNVMAALQDGAVLGAYRATPTRRLVWEIGGGWGGFAYQFKTLCPNVTYLITGIPDTFLLSAVYVMSVMAGARCRFYDRSSSDDLWCDWENVDFVFAPESALPALKPPRIDLALDIMSMRRMGELRVRSHVQYAFDHGAPYFYSLLPSACCADRVPSIWKAIEERYWTHPMPHTSDRAKLGEDDELEPDSEYAHIVGWRRIRA